MSDIPHLDRAQAPHTTFDVAAERLAARHASSEGIAFNFNLKN
jgi:hypothetical protein